MSDAYPGSLGDVAVQMLSSDYLEAASLTILFYDFFLTLGKESKRFWERPTWSSAIVLFYLNRYVGLSGYIVIAFFFMKPDFLVSTNSCSRFELFIQLHVGLIQIIISGILVLRTTALYRNDRRVKYGLCILVSLMVVNGLVQWCIRTFKGAQDSSVSQGVVEDSPLKRDCYIPYGHQQSIELASNWAFLLVLDTIVFILTIRKTLRVESLSGRSNLWSTLLRDGCIYFALLSISNVPNILVILLSPPYLKNLLPIFVNTLSSTAISRLMLNLRNPFQETPGAATPVVDRSRAKDDNDLEEGGTSRNP